MVELKKNFPWYRSASENGEPLTREELAEIYDLHHPSIYRFIYRQIGDVDISRELASEVFCRMLQALKKDAEMIQHLVPWLFCTARNLVIDHFRRQQFRNHLPFREELVESPNNTAEAAAFRVSARQMRDALQELTPDQRQVILLKFLEGLSNQEVADALLKPVGAIKSLQHRALCALRDLLVPEEEREAYEHEYARNPGCCY